MGVYLGSNQIGILNYSIYEYYNTDLEDSFINKTISSYDNSEIYSLRYGAFYNCSSLTNINFSNCTTIEDYAFYNCSLLTNISFPNCITIKPDAFNGCHLLSQASFPNCIIIGDYAFHDCSSLIDVNFPDCTTIGNYAFRNCYSLTNISFPNCRYIENYTFYRCYSLTTVNFPLCTSIGNNAFRNCSSLTNANFPSCISIGGYVFYQCSSLTSVSFPICTSIGDYAFFYCTNLTTVNFPSCTSIGNGAFQACFSLISISFLNCTIIGDYAFSDCNSLTSANFPNCTYIGNSAFTYCNSLTSISFPSCTAIGNYAFYNCYNLLSLYLTSVSAVPMLIGLSVFSSTPIGGYTTSTGGVYGSVYVPASLYSNFLVATNWSSIASRIVKYTETMTIDYYDAQYSEEYRYEPSMTWADWVNSEYNTAGFYVSNNHIDFNDSIDGLSASLEDDMGDYVLLNENIVDTIVTENARFYIGAHTSKSGFEVADNSGDFKYFIYEINMTWAEWVNSNYNTAGFVIDTNTSYVGIWDSINNRYIYLVDLNDSTNMTISSHKIVEDIMNKFNFEFQIDTIL